MRRKDREVADLEGRLAILEQCPVCRVAINDPASGVPYLVPLNFGMAAGPQSLTLYFHCAPVGTKLDLLRADPNVSFEADCPRDRPLCGRRGKADRPAGADAALPLPGPAL